MYTKEEMAENRRWFSELPEKFQKKAIYDLACELIDKFPEIKLGRRI